MSKFACFVPNEEREEEYDPKVAKDIGGLISDMLNKPKAQGVDSFPFRANKPKAQMCCAETDMNGYTFTQALVDQHGNVTCTECGKELL